MWVESAELRETMDGDVARLPDKRRRVCVLADREGLSTKESAEPLDIAPAGVKVRLHRARLLRREHLTVYFSGRQTPERSTR